MHVPKELRDKLEPVSEKGRFLGYEPDAKAYRILREQDNRVIVSRDVICYDCAWLSLTALSTVTRNLWL
jgi:hypothetical protein